jgi:hypothetical protein
VSRTASRLARLLGRDGNPLRRRTDRLEAAIIVGLLVTFLIAAPILAIFAGRVTDDLQLRQQQAERAWRQVPAVLLRSPDPMSPPFGPAGDWVPARWTTPGGEQREGRIAVDSTVRAGQSVPVWVDGAGRLTPPPLAHREIMVNVTLAAMLTPLGVAVMLVVAGWSARRLLDRRRIADWERAWRSVGPKWTRQP